MFVGPWLSSWLSSLSTCGILKSLFCGSSLCASLRFVIEGLDQNITSVSTLHFSLFFTQCFFLVCPMDTPHPAEFFSLLGRGLISRGNMRLCLLVYATSYPDDVLCAFYDAQLRWSRGGAAGSTGRGGGGGSHRLDRGLRVSGGADRWHGRRQERRHFRWRALEGTFDEQVGGHFRGVGTGRL